MHPDTFYRVALSRVRNIGPILTRALTDHFGSAAEVFRAKASDLRSVPGVADGIISELQRPEAQQEAEKITSFADRHDIRVFHYQDADFPNRMRHMAGSPALFYYKGAADLNARRTIAIVGTRQPSSRGIRQTEQLLAELSSYQPLVYSGLAYGIDIHAHRNALQHELSTVAVLGSGLDRIYPDIHRTTARRMLSAGGLLTTHPHWMSPEREHFPARNRIVAMLAEVIIVVESDRKGGSIITANMARTMGRPVAAFPGRTDDKKSAGCNQLIKEGGWLIERGEDIVDRLGWQKSKLAHRQGRLFQELSAEERAVVEQLSDQHDATVDQLRRSLSWSPVQLAGKLLEMEIKGLIRALPGQRYRLT